MAKIENKTKKNKRSVQAFMSSVKNSTRQRDSKILLGLMKGVTNKKPEMWGPSIVGFGTYHYKRKDGSEHEFFMTGFSPRVQSMSVYIMPGFKKYQDLLKKLGPHKTSVGCLYIKDLSEIHLPTLKKIVADSYKEMKKRYETK